MFSYKRLLKLLRPMRHYALLDAHGICRALRQSREKPQSGIWIEVQECNLSWLGRALPASARINTICPTCKPMQAVA